MTVYEVLAMGWLPTLPEGFEAVLGRYALLAAFAGSAAGAVLWLAGSRFSRSLVTVLSPKLGRVLTYSLVGLSMLVVMGGTAVRMSRPDWLDMLPRSVGMQVAVIVGLVGVGVMIQWRLTPVRFGWGVGAENGREAK